MRCYATLAPTCGASCTIPLALVPPSLLFPFMIDISPLLIGGGVQAIAACSKVKQTSAASEDAENDSHVMAPSPL